MSKNPEKGLFIGNSHENGGIPSKVVETGQLIEIEGDEYYICREAYNSSEEYSFKGKTNKQILEKFYTDHSCKLDQKRMNAGDFIVCKVVVLDKKKYDRNGTIKQILNEMQGEKSCKVESGSQRLKRNGGNINFIQMKHNTPKVYIADLAAYNEGKLIGEWVDLADYDSGEEVMKHIGSLLKKWSKQQGVLREEWAVHDCEYLGSECSEYMGEADFDKIIEAISVSKNNDIPVDVLITIQNEHEPDDLQNWVNERYEGKFDSDSDLGNHYIDSLGGENQLSQQTLMNYFDYDRFSRDLAYDYVEYDDHYFRNTYERGGKTYAGGGEIRYYLTLKKGLTIPNEVYAGNPYSGTFETDSYQYSHWLITSEQYNKLKDGDTITIQGGNDSWDWRFKVTRDMVEGIEEIQSTTKSVEFAGGGEILDSYFTGELRFLNW